MDKSTTTDYAARARELQSENDRLRAELFRQQQQPPPRLAEFDRCIGSFCQYPSVALIRCELTSPHLGEHGKMCVPGITHYYAPGEDACRCGNTGMAGNV